MRIVRTGRASFLVMVALAALTLEFMGLNNDPLGRNWHGGTTYRAPALFLIPDWGSWAIRTTGDPAQLSGQVRAEIRKLDPSLLINELQPMSAWMDRAQAGTRFSLLLIGVFALIAALLAGVGLYGVLATVVRQRTAEIGVRMAIGAAPARIFSLVVGHGIRLSAAGILLGFGGALGLTRVMTSMLVGVKPTDLATFAVVAVLFFAIAALASWVPARRAAALDPTSALREE